MNTEFVAFDDGVEVDWIDPVLEVKETETEWVINNGWGLYAVEKIPGRTAITRPVASRIVSKETR